MRCREVPALTAAAILALAVAAGAQPVKLRASLRSFDFLRLESKPGDAAARHDTEFASFRLMPELSFGRAIRIETHLVLDMTSPAGSPAAAMATGRARTFLPLDHDLSRTESLDLRGYFDRLNVRVHTAGAELVVGRQAITWGVNTFWPSLDLFAPFAPTRMDRDYKPGVDAVRLTVPIGSRTEVQAVGAVLGDSRRRDGAGAILLRVNAGPADLGLMGGSFHGDTVAGGFVTASVAGSLLRAEVAWTRTGDALDRLRRPSFWRGGIGLERQLSSSVNLVAEVAANGYGESDALGYPAVLASDRMQRGEVGGLGRWHAGTAVTWQFHPLGTLSDTVLVNCDDASIVWIPWLAWSVSGDLEIFVGAQVAIGHGPGSGGVPRSEYGSFASRALAGFKLYL